MVQAVADHLRYWETMGITEVPRSATIPNRGGQSGGGRNAGRTTHDAGRQLRAIREEIGDCTRCKLCGGRTQIVFGVGNPQAELMFIGEGPGADEDRQGEPFVGRAGQLLTKIIEAMGYRRDEVYIGNVVKCRPPQNRAPDPEEIATCIPFLYQQIAAIRPKVIVCLGSIATHALLQTDAKISQLRGTFHPLPEPGTGPMQPARNLDRMGPVPIQVMPTFHPAYLLRNPEQKRAVWEDMKKVAAHLRRSIPPPPPGGADSK